MKTKQNELRLLCRNHSVRLVYLFGSRQTEGRRYLFEGLKPRLQSSDLDIAELVDGRNYRFFADAHKEIFADLLKKRELPGRIRRKSNEIAEDLRFKSIEFHRDFAQARSDGYFEIKLVKN